MQVNDSTHAAPPPVAQLWNMIIVGPMVARAITVAARLDLATEIAEETVSSEELARRTETQPDGLYRMMRALASVGVFVETEPGHFRNTPLSEMLRADGPASARALPLFFGDDTYVKAWLGLDHSLKTGESGFVHVHGAQAFEYAQTHPEVGEVFNNAMTYFSAATGPMIASAYDFGGIERLVDVGGGHGQLLATIVERHPAVHGILFDLPPVVAGAPALLESLGLAARIEVVGGDFFQAVPTADAYVMKSVLHDWSDEDALRILENIHDTAAPGARLVLAETVLQPGNQPDVAKFMDLEMLVMAGGGRERSAGEWTELLRSGGFALDRVIPTPSPLAVIEAHKI